MTTLCRYTYDPLDRLASRTPLAEAMARRFYRADQMVTEIQGTEQRSYLRIDARLLAQNNPAGSALLATDPQNSVLHAEDTAIAYTPYGHREHPATLPGMPGFNGEQPDPVTGHYLLGNGYRAYNPTLMRFNSPDNLSPFGKGGLNAYAYCVGDPVNRSDPTGHFGGLVTVISKMLVSGVWALKNAGNQLHGAFAQGLSGRGAGAASRLLYNPQSLQDAAVAKIVQSGLPVKKLPPTLKSEVLFYKSAQTETGERLQALMQSSPQAAKSIPRYVKTSAASANADTISPEAIYRLRRIALGDEVGYLPDQVLSSAKLKAAATSIPQSRMNDFEVEMSKLVRFGKQMKIRGRDEKLFSR